MPAGQASAIYLVSVAQADGLELTLPPVAAAAARFVTVRRLDSQGSVLIRAAAGDAIQGDTSTSCSRTAWIM